MSGAFSEFLNMMKIGQKKNYYGNVTTSSLTYIIEDS